MRVSVCVLLIRLTWEVIDRSRPAHVYIWHVSDVMLSISHLLTADAHVRVLDWEKQTMPVYDARCLQHGCISASLILTPLGRHTQNNARSHLCCKVLGWVNLWNSVIVINLIVIFLMQGARPDPDSRQFSIIISTTTVSIHSIHKHHHSYNETDSVLHLQFEKILPKTPGGAILWLRRKCFKSCNTWK